MDLGRGGGYTALVARGFILSSSEVGDRTSSGQRQAGGGSVWSTKQFTRLPIRIGRNKLNDFPVPLHFVSDFHGIIEDVGGRICLRDLGSKNGIYVRAGPTEAPTRIEPQQPVDMAPYGYEFYMGPFVKMSLQPIDVDAPASVRGSKMSGTVLATRA